MTQQFTITVSRPDGTSIPVVVTKKRVKNFNLRVTSSGEVHASAPLGASRERIEAFVKRNSAWIISRLAQREQRQATAREPLSPSSIIALWGKPITVQDALDHNFTVTRTAAQAGHLRKFYRCRQIERTPTGQAARNPRRPDVR